MTSTTMTREARIHKVLVAHAELAAAIDRAEQAEGGQFEASEWEQVEALGAVIHRQARLLAGKRRGG